MKMKLVDIHGVEPSKGDVLTDVSGEESVFIYAVQDKGYGRVYVKTARGETGLFPSVFGLRWEVRK
jgi:hypothetical protein